MTDHLTDEALSALLDDAATDDERAHAEGCPTCRGALDQLRRAARAVATPPPAPAPEARDAAIARAVAAAGGGAGRVVPLRRYRPGLLAAAAALVLVLAAVPLLISSRDDADEKFANVGSRLDGGDRASDVFVGPGDDLGDVADEAALRQVLTARLTATGSSDAAAGGGGGSGSAGGADSGATASGTESQAAEGAPQPVAPPETGASRSSGAAPVDCSDEARDNGAGRGALVYSARLRFKGQPAQVLVFEAPASEPRDYRALVMAEANCQLLVFQSF
jgi:hypothetical protein